MHTYKTLTSIDKIIQRRNVDFVLFFIIYRIISVILTYASIKIKGKNELNHSK